MSWLVGMKKVKSDNEARVLLKEAFLNPGLYVSDSDERLGVPSSSLISDYFSEKLSAAQQQIIAKAAADLLQQWTESKEPPIEAREELAYFIGNITHEGIRQTVYDLVDKRSSLNNGDKEFHAQLLACLFNYEEQVESSIRKGFIFWKRQGELLGNGYEALLWSGMLQNDIDKAFSQFPVLFGNIQAALKVKLILGWIVSTFFEDNVSQFKNKLNGILTNLPANVREVFFADTVFEIDLKKHPSRKYPIHVGRGGAFPGRIPRLPELPTLHR